VGLLALLLVVYQASRLLGGRDVAGAFENARHVLAVQAWLGLPDEQEFQDVVLAAAPLVRAANAYYAAVHLPVTAGVLLWLMLVRPAVYRRARTALVASTAVALAVYLLVPVAPPRMPPPASSTHPPCTGHRCTAPPAERS
jgi:hypothetical protein